MSKVFFVTYAGDCCCFEAIEKQQSHEDRIVMWLNSGMEISVMAFNIENRPGLDMLIAIGTTDHDDLCESVIGRDSAFEFEGEKYSIDGELGGFCVRKNGIGVVHTRDSNNFGSIRSNIGNIHRQMILIRLDHLLKMANLDQNRKARKARSPQCKKPILSFENQLAKIKAWRDDHESWNYEGKGGFPEIPENIIELGEAAPQLDGFRPVVEINFYLATIQEHLDFVRTRLWFIALGKGCPWYGWSENLSAPVLKHNTSSPRTWRRRKTSTSARTASFTRSSTT